MLREVLRIVQQSPEVLLDLLGLYVAELADRLRIHHLLEETTMSSPSLSVFHET